MAVQPKCSICGLDLMSNEGKDGEGKIIEPQTSYWMHDPRNIHVDVQVTAHTDCYDKVKTSYPNFDKPVQTDYAAVKYPVLSGTTVSLKTPLQLINLKTI
jgi:hypothetical protein